MLNLIKGLDSFKNGVAIAIMMTVEHPSTMLDIDNKTYYYSSILQNGKMIEVVVEDGQVKDATIVKEIRKN